MIYDLEIDAIGLLCPLPVLKARKALKSLTSGQSVALIATDPAAVIDVPHFCAEAGHTFVGSFPEGDATRYVIRKG